MAKIALLDGGNGQEILRRSGRSAHPLWSLKVMLDTPEVIGAVHEDFLRAGARVLSTNTYAATPTRMAAHGYGDRFEMAQATAIDLARKAVADRPAGTVQIAGCLPPLVASFRAEVSKGHAASLEEYRRIVAAQDGKVDVFLIETMSNVAEATAALDAAQGTETPVYLGLTISDDGSDTLRSGEPLASALATLCAKRPDGIFLNCSTPEAITRAMPRLADTGVPFGGYANGFTSVDALEPGGTVASLRARTGLTPEVYAEFAETWIDLGATIVGGCCEVGPDHIATLAARLTAAGHEITALG